ncbi:phage minor capsid protein, partial [Desulfovibrio desulfuricans]|nr:phage minor capsid protein [Desulfovibrio desulfuricans]
MNLLENQQAAERIDSVYIDLESSLMQNIVRHLKGYEQPIASDKWQLQKLAEIGKLNQE